ncbi:MAG: hypothetical protein KDA51_17030, partial [Planctomycetales bacterium]|nr:hypothetical protein [Planctomycetales bacterium]
RGASASGRHTAISHDTISLDKLSAERARSHRQAQAAKDSGQSSRRFAIGSEEPLLRTSDVLVIADDSGIEVDALGGAPGIYSARYAGVHGDDDANNRKLLKELGDREGSSRAARFVCAISLANQREVLFTVQGSVEGEIAVKAVGDRGFGYDPVFYYPPYKKTFGEVEPSKKNAVSHRANALSAFKSRFVELMHRSGLII